MMSPFFGESGYSLSSFYYVNKDSSTGAIVNPFSIVYTPDGNMSFTGSDSGIASSVGIGMNIGYSVSKDIIKFDRRAGSFFVVGSLIDTGSTNTSGAGPGCGPGTTWDGTSCAVVFVATQTVACG